MKKRISPGMIVLAVLFILLVLLMAYQPKELNWSRDYTSTKKIPYGGEVAWRFFNEINEGEVEQISIPAFSLLNNESFTARNYLIFNSVFHPDRYDVEELLRFTSEGNTVFISAYEFSDLFEDTLGFHVSDKVSLLMEGKEGQDFQALDSLANSPVMNFVNPKLKSPQDFSFPKKAYNYCFSRFDTSVVTVLGRTREGDVNFVHMPYGKGGFYIHTVPDVFSNYFAAKPQTAPYVFRALSYLPPQDTFWDDYYKDGFRLNGESRSVLFSYESLRAAYAVLAGIAFLGFFFSLKRRQRIIPVLKPLANTTLEFVEAVGTLYYHQRNTADIMHKKITYFLESIRTRFFVKTTTFDDDFIRKITALSGVPYEEVHRLFYEIARMQHYSNFTDEDLKNLEEMTWEFNSKSKR